MTYFLYGLFFLSCIVLIITVLLQPGKSDAGALFTSSVSSNAYGARGTATVLSKTTIVAATLFMLSALMLAMPALNGDISVLSTNPEATTETPAANTNANVSSNADANAVSPVTIPPITNVSNVATPAPANTAVNTTKANTEKKPDVKKEANTKK
ncbi:MAG TPA: preprotein translocase subunit SecG [Pyrinomonadaceae bacterium]|nr:preprotein translocase subunit SecG [Pyrinomonadaceae bacterium]